MAAALGFVVVLLDVSVVNVALDALRQEFATDVAGLQWVINAYTLVFAALLLTSGALGDRFDARRVFLLGFVVFTLASAACGLSGSLPILIAARLIQGLGLRCWCRIPWPCCSTHSRIVSSAVVQWAGGARLAVYRWQQARC